MVPILVCLFTFVLFFFRVMQVQLCVQDALEDTGRTLSVYAAVNDSQEEKYAVLAKSMFIAKAREDDNIRKFVTGNVFGITFSESSFEGNDISLRFHSDIPLFAHLLPTELTNSDTYSPKSYDTRFPVLQYIPICHHPGCQVRLSILSTFDKLFAARARMTFSQAD